MCQYSENTVFDSNDQRISLDLICNCKMNLICLLFFSLNNWCVNEFLLIILFYLFYSLMARCQVIRLLGVVMMLSTPSSVKQELGSMYPVQFL